MARLDVLAAVALGGVLGAEVRYGVGLALPHGPSAFPWSTLLINASGCLLIGVLMVVITELVTPHRLARPLLGVGVLGGYTTFSSATVDTLTLAVAGRPWVAAGYSVATALLAVVACAVGVGGTRLAAGRLTRAEDARGNP
jgi:CrcB protein